MSEWTKISDIQDIIGITVAKETRPLVEARSPRGLLALARGVSTESAFIIGYSSGKFNISSNSLATLLAEVAAAHRNGIINTDQKNQLKELLLDGNMAEANDLFRSFSQATQKWSCNTCTAINEVSLSNCTVCGTKRQQQESSISAGVVGTNTGGSGTSTATAAGWVCAACTFSNTNGTQSCVVCGMNGPDLIDESIILAEALEKEEVETLVC